ncbi:hypothetical protein EDB83DRAFT_426096 [Lactarius deliciosus]|nr:hypothetical protein EDB83DRAFT_426096 [Lactarius deliciosus]
MRKGILQRERRKVTVREFSSRVPPARVPSALPKERRRSNADPSGGRVQSGRPSSAFAAPIVRVARWRSMRSACTLSNGEPTCCPPFAARPSIDRSEKEPTRTADTYLVLKNPRETPRVPQAPRQHFPARPITTRAGARSHRVRALSAHHRSAKQRCGAQASIQHAHNAQGWAARQTARNERSREAGFTVEHGEARRLAGRCTAEGTPTKWGSARWVRRTRAGAARKLSKDV